ncbi:MAG TPA: ABC transporter ATP-binding protein [Polyangia bacterium]|nr:ABC transporter ATP-binding protein [Polyangia bacterium]
MASASPVPITISELTVRYGATVAVDGVTLAIEPGELFLLLGPSGCGKTTLLRALAGFVAPDAGAIRFGDEDVTRLPAHQRNAGMVFQSFALWPHLSVFENVAFGLRERRVAKGELAARVEAALASTRLPGYGGRRVDELSGGEQQRVALARALVVRPRCLLLDEPLSNLDAKLRHSMREEIRRLCKEHGLTTVYVTHDQKEALAVADRVGVMSGGRLLQAGSPSDVYRRPRSRAVAAFVGETNLLAGRVTAAAGTEVRVESPVGALVAARDAAFAPAAGDDVWISIRPECLRLVRGGEAAPNTLRGRVERVTYLGELAEHRVRVGDTALALFELNARAEARAEVVAAVDPRDVVLLPRDEPGGGA